MEYGLYLMSRLYAKYFPKILDAEYDVAYDEIKEFYAKFKGSNYDVDARSEHDCIVIFLEDVRDGTVWL